VFLLNSRYPYFLDTLFVSKKYTFNSWKTKNSDLVY